MANAMNAALASRISPGLTNALRPAVHCAPRSIANRMEVLIRDYYGRDGIAITEPSARKSRPAEISDADLLS